MRGAAGLLLVTPLAVHWTACGLRSIILPFSSERHRKEYVSWKDVLSSLCDRTVAVVGNAASLSGTTLGKSIDSNDVVFRFNSGAIVQERTARGARTDFAVLSPPHKWQHVIKQLPSSVNILHVTNSARGNSTYIKTPKKLNDALWKRMGRKPSSGAMTVNFILSSSCPVKQLTVFGFDWKRTPSFYENMQAPLTPNNEKHNYANEEAWFKKLCKAGKLQIVSSIYGLGHGDVRDTSCT